MGSRRSVPSRERPTRSLSILSTLALLASVLVVGGTNVQPAFAITAPWIVADSVVDAQVGNVTSIAISNHGAVAGDLLIVQIARDNTDNVNPPTGWSSLRRDSLSSSYQEIFWRVAGSSEPATSTWSFTSVDSDTVIYSARIVGADPTTPFGAHAATATASASDITAPSINSAATDSLLMTLYIGETGNDFYDPPPGMTERADLRRVFVSLYAAAETITAAGTTGTRTATAVTPIAHDSVGVSLAINPVGTASALYVNSTGDAPDATPGDDVCDTGGLDSQGQPECTLRAAIQEANLSPTFDAVHFGLPTSDSGHSSGVWTIAPASALPALTSPIRVDSTTQPGYATPVVRLDGNSAAGATGISLDANADASEIHGLMITRFDGDGIRVASGADGVRIIDNWIGSDNTGTQAMGNGDDGLDIWGANAVVDGNVVNYSSDEGIDVRADGITITGNLIGLEFGGSTGIGNTDVGIALFGANATIGGDTPAERNVISLNWEGIEVNTSGNIIQGNYIGTDSSGLLPRGNRIGDGIEVQSGTGNRVGGSLPGQGNLVAFNQLKGVDVTGGSASVLGNDIHSNGGLGIDVGPTGVTANSGADSWLNFPVITGASEIAGSVMVDFDLDVPAGDYRIDVFTNPAGADPSGYGEGGSWRTAATFTHAGAGSQSFQITYTGSPGDEVTLTATEQSAGPTFGSTSEFSLASTASGPVPLVVNSTGDASDTVPGDGVCTTGGSNSGGDPECTLRAAIEESNGASNANAISFAIPQSDANYAVSPEVFTITPGSVYDDIVHPVIIDGATQAEYGPNPVIQLDGSSATGATAGLVLETDHSTINGLISHSFDDEGLEIDGSTGGGRGNTLSNNWVGVDASGAARPNLDFGVLLAVNARDNTISGNLISGNVNSGLAIRNPGSDNNIVRGNTIGLSPDGLDSRPNGAHGIEINDTAASNLIGGPDPGDGNVLASNTLDGVYLRVDAGSGNAVIRNEIQNNGGLGINHAGGTVEDAYGVTANDAGDGDSGPNDHLNHPVITSATESGGILIISGTFDVPAGSYRFDFYKNPAGADASGSGEGGQWVATSTLSHSGAGPQAFGAAFPGAATDVVTATVTEEAAGPVYGSTSEFSRYGCADSDGDGLCDVFEALFGDTDGDLTPNELDSDDDDDGTPTASENADPNGDGDPRDAQDIDRDGEPDYFDLPTIASPGTVATAQKISETQGGLVATLTTNDHFGRSVAAIGDVDGDGVTDIAASAPWDDDGGADRGAVYILFMNTNGTVKAEQKISDLVGGLGAVLDNSDEFGIGVAGLGDLDGDGISDIAVGSHQDDDGLNGNGGAVFVLFLNADGTVKAEQKISETAGGLGVLFDANDRFGSSVANIGDLDGDGLNDLVVGAKDDDDAFANSGAVYVLFLGSDGTVRSSQKISQTAGGLVGAPLGSSDGFGISVAGLGDVDGDGFADIAVGSYWDDDGGTNHGAVYVLFLNPDGTVKAQQKISDTAGGLAAVLASNDEFGTAVGGVGDLDADGVPDLLIGAPKDDDGFSLSGAAYVVFLNSNGTVKGEQKISNTEGSLGVTLNTSDQFGFAVAGTGDLDGDGTIGLAVGVYGDDDGGPADRGAVYVLDLDGVGATISGTVFEDISGDLLTDGVIGSAANPGSVGVDVHLHDGGGSFVATDTTDASGAYSFPYLPDGTYTVWVDSATVPSAQDPTAPQGDIWAEQTYGPVAAPCANGTGSSFANVAAGSCFGGSSGSLSDNSTLRLHQVPVSLSGSDVTNIDFGFSFNVVTNQRGGGLEDDDTGTNRTVQGSLRQFIQNANAIDGPNAMRFVPVEPADASDGVDAWWHVGVSNVLPTLATGDTTVDGTALDLVDGVTERDDNTRGPELELDGTGIAVTTDGLTITGGTVTVRDLVINNFTRDGIRVTTAGSNTIAGNYIGTNAVGTAGAGNGNDGIRILSAGSNTIGGSSAADRNVISGNGNNGLLIDGLPSTGNVIQGNYVGLNATGDAAIGNTDDGVDLSDAPGNTVGGTAPGAGNVISGQGDVGLLLVGSGTTGNLVQGNRIGTNALGTAPVPNLTGVGITSGASSNTIGGTTSAHRNVISGNGDDGVRIAGVGTSGNSVIGNSIVSNIGLGIDLVGGAEDGYGVTTNDPSDIGPNDLLDHPVITSATISGGIITLSGTFDAPAGSYRFEFFLNPAGGDGSGHGEGDVLVGSSTLAHTGSGPEPFGAAFPGSAGDVISATITEESAGPVFGSTSEFSAWIIATANGGIALDSSVRRSDMVALGGLDLSGSVAGVAGEGIDLAGGSQRLSGPATDIESSALTLSGWVRLDTAGNDPRIVAKAANDGTAIYELLVDDATGEAVARLNIGGGTVEVRGGSVPTGSWHQLAATWNGTTVRLFVDGVEVNSAAGAGTLATDVSVPLNVGNLAAANRGADGRIDHVEISHTARSGDHIATAFANITDPASFVSMGVAQTSAPPAWTVSTSIGHSGSNSLAAPEVAAGAEAWATAIGIDEPGVEFRTWWLVSDPTLVTTASGSRTGMSPTDQNETALTPSGFDLATLVGSTRTQEASTATTMGAATWTEVILRTDESGTSSVWVDGVQILGPILHSGGAATGSVGLRAAAIPTGEAWYVDDARLRRFVSDEPVTSLGPLDRS